jgi:hypothetical protein
MLETFLNQNFVHLSEFHVRIILTTTTEVRNNSNAEVRMKNFLGLATSFAGTKQRWFVLANFHAIS